MLAANFGVAVACILVNKHVLGAAVGGEGFHFPIAITFIGFVVSSVGLAALEAVGARALAPPRARAPRPRGAGGAKAYAEWPAAATAGSPDAEPLTKVVLQGVRQLRRPCQGFSGRGRTTRDARAHASLGACGRRRWTLHGRSLASM